jgi:hypothetical protein
MWGTVQYACAALIIRHNDYHHSCTAFCSCSWWHLKLNADFRLCQQALPVHSICNVQVKLPGQLLLLIVSATGIKRNPFIGPNCAEDLPAQYSS